MTYCTQSDIETEVKRLDLSEASAVLDGTEIDEFISQESALIDSYLSGRYVTPVTGASSLLVLKRICIALVAWRVSDILSTKKQQVLPNGIISQDLAGATAYKQAIKQLNDLKSGSMRLSDATAVNQNKNTSYFASNNVDTAYESELDTSEKQW